MPDLQRGRRVTELVLLTAALFVLIFVAGLGLIAMVDWALDLVTGQD